MLQWAKKVDANKSYVSLYCEMSGWPVPPQVPANPELWYKWWLAIDNPSQKCRMIICYWVMYQIIIFFFQRVHQPNQHYIRKIEIRKMKRIGNKWSLLHGFHDSVPANFSSSQWCFFEISRLNLNNFLVPLKSLWIWIIDSLREAIYNQW